MEESEKLNALQALLTKAYLDYERERGRRIRDNEFAKYLGVPPGSFNQWINGNRLPNYDNAIKLAAKLGPEVFDVLGYDRIYIVDDPWVIYIAQHWRKLDHEIRKQIFDHVREEMGELEKK